MSEPMSAAEYERQMAEMDQKELAPPPPGGGLVDRGTKVSAPVREREARARLEAQGQGAGYQPAEYPNLQDTMLNRAMKERWPIRDETRRRADLVCRAIIDNPEEESKVKLQALKVLAALDALNVAQDKVERGEPTDAPRITVNIAQAVIAQLASLPAEKHAELLARYPISEVKDAGVPSGGDEGWRTSQGA